MTAVKENSAQYRFELPIEGTHEVAAAYYRINGDKIVLTRTIAPERLSGQGLASRLAHGTFEAIRASGRKAVLLCPFMAAYNARHTEFAQMVAPENAHD